MKELQAICEAYRKIDFNKHKAALATVVRVKGSSYRSQGARMLITDNGHWVGSISGGCLEGDALRKARKVMTDKQCFSTTYDTSDDENSQFSINLGCNGIIDVLFEPVDPEDLHNPFHFFEGLLGMESNAALATVISGSDKLIGKKVLLSNNREIANIVFPKSFPQLIVADLHQLFENKKPGVKRYESGGVVIEVFMEYIQPPIHLMIFGGGFDARPLSQMAKSLGWKVTVTDECVAHIAPVFFPGADKLSLCDRKFVDREFAVGPNTACVLMSHNYEYDRDVLKKLIQSETPYIGILGPKKRFQKMINEFLMENIRLSDEDLHRIHAPIGIDIGAETPDEIAIAIISEIMGKFSEKPAGYLKHRKGPIHQRDDTGNEVLEAVIALNNQ